MWELLAATAKEFKTIYPDLDDDDRDPMKPRFERVNRIG